MNRKVVLTTTIVLLLTAIFLSACSGGAPGAVAVASKEIQDYWSQTVSKENGTEADWLSMLTTRSEGISLLKNQNPLFDRCTVITGQVMEDIVSGRYDDRNSTGQPTGVVNAQLAIQALGVTEAYPDFSVCQQILTKMANDATAYRLRNIDLYNRIWDDKEDLDTRYYGDLGKALANQLLAYAGAEFMKTDLAAHFAPPKIWFPTFNMEAFVTEKERCDAFDDDYPGQARWSNAFSRCQVIGQAAYDLIFRPILSQETIQEINTGIDSVDPFAVTAVPTPGQ